ncbi:class I mannose-6-phosphate isomerase [Clostridium sediminicola]|uniref:type I phosphomannose isomerase catalytic subunit n=1 Tax=Clostridium sediminicola TaxID=3114879 RepID=UPI0031F24EDD
MDLELVKFSCQPLKLLNNRVWRSYTGGKLIEEWQGESTVQDSDKPEEWVGSIVEARNKNYIKDEGLSFVQIDSNKTIKLIDLISSNSTAFLGENHVNKYGDTMAVLTKVLDAAIRLSIQVHPNKDYAKKFFNSNFGKTEAWYIIGGRRVNGEPPYVLLGFKEHITKEKWEEFFEKQDINAMINSLHKFYVKSGDVFLIEGSVPHAIGSGCFLIEVQEPTDYTMRVEKTAFDGSQLPDTLCHQGVGFEKMLECFNYEGLSRKETLNRWYKTPNISREEPGGEETVLIGNKDTKCFSMKKFTIKDNFQVIHKSGFRVIIALSGNGKLIYKDGVVDIKQGDMFFIPQGIKEITYKNNRESILEIIGCYPPQ